LVEVLENFDIDASADELISLYLLEEDPKTYQEVMRSIDANFWKKAIKSEIDSLEQVVKTIFCNQFWTQGVSMQSMKRVSPSQIEVRNTYYQHC